MKGLGAGKGRIREDGVMCQVIAYEHLRSTFLYKKHILRKGTDVGGALIFRIFNYCLKRIILEA